MSTSTEKLLQLSQSNTRVAELIAKNQALIDSSKFILKEYKTGISMNPPIYPYQMSGKIMKNGFLYAESENETINYHSVLNWKAHFGMPYVKTLVGKIDFLGYLRLDVTEFGYSFPFPKRTIQFKSQKFDVNELVLIADKIETQINRNEFTTHLLGDPFSKNELKRKEFIRNRDELLTYLHD